MDQWKVGRTNMLFMFNDREIS